MESKNTEKVEPPETLEDPIQEELAAEKKKNGELLTRLKYAQADLENYRKRVDREMKDAGESQMRGLISRLLVVQDELDLAVKHSDEGGELKEGIAMVRKNLRSALEASGVERIDCVGQPFDPALHEAVAKVQGAADQDVVVEEVRSGFTFRGHLLRPSMVKVELASKTAKQEEDEDE